jgi:NADPH:quinone reductase-like Zn-dependent oxidoreductase
VALLKLGETVLVTGGSGGVGLPAVQIVKAMGARVIAVTRSAAKRDVLLESGASNVVVSTDGADFSKEVLSLTSGEGVDVVADTVGSRVFMPAFRSLADGGRYLVIGQLVREDIAINPARIIFKAATLSGIVNARRDQLEDTIKLVAAGIVRPRVAKVLPLAEAAQAHMLVEAGNLIGRVVLQP